MRHPLEISFETDGWLFIKEIFDSVYGYSAIGTLLMVALLYLYLKENRENKYIFLMPIFVMVVTIYNPVFIKYFLYDVVGIIYYRYFWILPVTTIITYVAIYVLKDIQSKKKQLVISFFILFIIIYSGIPVTERGISLISNRYAIPDEVLNIAAVIHNDSNASELQVVDLSENSGYLRMYDASLIQPYKWEELEGRPDEWKNYLPNVNYVVYPLSGDNSYYIIESGGIEVARTENTIIYRIEASSQ